MSDEVTIWRKLLNGWMAIAARFGFIQTMLLLVLFYVVLIGPAWAVSAISRRDLLAKRGLRAKGSVWQKAESAEPDLERAKLLS